MKEFIRVMKALSDPTRIKLLKILEKRLMCVCELQAAIGTAQSTTSNHLKILEAAGLVEAHKELRQPRPITNRTPNRARSTGKAS